MDFFDFHHHNPALKFGIYNLKYGEQPPGNYFSAGIHPDSVSENLDLQFKWLSEISKSKNCVAIGECGLDGRFVGTDDLQEEVFSRQIDLANKLQKPLIIHCVKRFSRLIYLCKKAKTPMIIHGFNKRRTIGDELLRNHFCLSFGKSLLDNVDLQDFFNETPLEKIFLETDASGAEIKEIYEKAAALKKLQVEELKIIIKNNLQSLQISI